MAVGLHHVMALTSLHTLGLHARVLPQTRQMGIMA